MKTNSEKAEKHSGGDSNNEQSIGKAKESRQSATAQRKAPSAEIIALKEQLAQRNDELAIINSIQQGLASKLDFNGIFTRFDNCHRTL